MSKPKAELAKARVKSAETPDTAAAAPVLDETTKRAWLRLIRTPHVGGVTFWELLGHFGRQRQPSKRCLNLRNTAAGFPPAAFRAKP